MLPYKEKSVRFIGESPVSRFEILSLTMAVNSWEWRLQDSDNRWTWKGVGHWKGRVSSIAESRGERLA